MDASLRGFMRATRTNEEEARKILDICEWNAIVASELFSLHPRGSSAALLSEIFFMLDRLPSDARKSVLDNFVQFFPRDIFMQCSQGLDAEDCEYLSIVALRAFANSSGTVQHEEFAQALQLGRTIVLPLFQEWKNELREMMKAGGEDLDWETPRARLRALLNQTLPSVVDANGKFCGLMEDVVNLNLSFSDEDAQTALHVAAHLGDVDLLTSLLACKANFDAKDSNGNTVLHLGVDDFNIVEGILSAAEQAQQQETFAGQVNDKGQTALDLCSNLESARLLLRACPSLVFAKDEDGNTAFHLHVHNPGMLKILSAAIPDSRHLEMFLTQANCQRLSALHLCRNVKCAQILLRTSPSLVFTQTRYGETALHQNVDNNSMAKVLFSVFDDAEQLERYVQQVDSSRQTALHFCKEVESACMLLRISPSLLFVDDWLNNTALHLHASNSSMVKVLLAAIDDAEQLQQFVQRVNNEGRTALHVCRNAESAQMLLQASPKLLFMTDSKGETALHLNASNTGMVKVLLSAAEEMEQLAQSVNAEGHTPLHLCKNLGSARLLLAAAPTLASTKCKAGCIPLHVHAMCGLQDICPLELEEFSVDVNAVNGRGQTPLHLACLFRRAEITAMILAHSPNLLARDDEQRTVLHYALMNGSLEEVVESYSCDYYEKDFDDRGRAIVGMLLKQGEAANLVAARDCFGKTALHYYVEFERKNFVLADMLMMAGADATAQSKRGETAMHLAARDEVSMAFYLVKRWGLSPRIKNKAGKPALDLVNDLKRRKELERASALARAVTLRFAANSRNTQCPWKRLPRELFRELCSFLV